MTLGKPGVKGNPPEALTEPTDVVTDPANGDVYVAESHTDVEDPEPGRRASRCSTGTASSCESSARPAPGPGEFRTPHALEFDSQGRLIVADRHNHRVQILTKEGKFIARVPGVRPHQRAGDRPERRDLHRRFRIDAASHPGWRKGVRIGSLKDGKVTIFIPPHKTPNSPDGAMGEGIAIDAAGNIFTAEAQPEGRHEVRQELTVMEAREPGRDAAERALREGLQRSLIVARATNDAVWDWNLASDTVWWNEGFETLFGHRRADVEPGAASWTSRLHPDDQARVVAAIHAAIDGGGETWSDEYRFRRADGTYAHVFDRGYVLRNADGHAVRMIGAMQDVTAQKDTYAALHESERRLRLATEAANVGLWDADLVTNTVWFSPEWKRQIGYPTTRSRRAWRNGPTACTPTTRRRPWPGSSASWRVSNRPTRTSSASGTVTARTGGSSRGERWSATRRAARCACSARTSTCRSCARPSSVSARRWPRSAPAKSASTSPRRWRRSDGWRAASPTISTTSSPSSAPTARRSAPR